MGIATAKTTLFPNARVVSNSMTPPLKLDLGGIKLDLGGIKLDLGGIKLDGGWY